MWESDHVLLHAAGVSRDGGAVALAGPPGAGKSSAALHLVDAGLRFLSNDRVLARAGAAGVEALGYPKQPRVNPGTLLGHPRLAILVKPDERAALERLEPSALWGLEAKRDVDLDAIYGPGTMSLAAELRALVLLRWRRDGQGLRLDRLSPTVALERLDLFRKDLGVFDLDRSPAGPPPRASWPAIGRSSARCPSSRCPGASTSVRSSASWPCCSPTDRVPRAPSPAALDASRHIDILVSADQWGAQGARHG